MLPQAAQDAFGVFLRRLDDRFQIGLANIGGAGAQDFFDHSVVHGHMMFLHQPFPEQQGALMGAVLLREALAGNGPSVGDGHHIHGSVADVTEHIDALEIGQAADNSSETLGEHIHAGNANAVFLPFED